MALADAIQGARHTGQSITWKRADQTTQVLTGAVVTARIFNPMTGASINSDGVFTVTDGANGVFSWVYGALDVGTSGELTVQFKADFSGVYDLTYETPFVVLPAL